MHRGHLEGDVADLTDPLLMNAFNNVNLAGAIILTNTDYATELGIPKSQWVYPLGGAGTKDSDKCECGAFAPDDSN